jgi:hypothetical protein
MASIRSHVESRSAATTASAETPRDALVTVARVQTDSRELIVGVASAMNAHLREPAALPSAASNHFDTRLSRASTDS